MAEPIEQVRLDQLRLGQRGRHLQQGLTDEHDPALRHRPYPAGELRAEQGCQIPPRPVQRRGEGIDVLGADMEPGQVVPCRLQSCRDQEAAFRGQVTDEEAERRRGGHPLP